MNLTNTQTIVKEILNNIEKRLMNFSYYPIDVNNIKFYPDSHKMCQMNSCGKYNTNWACPSGASNSYILFNRVKSYDGAFAFQSKYAIEDDFDWKSMELAGKNFNKLCITIMDCVLKNGVDGWVLGAGACDFCKSCTYPQSPCAHPQNLIYPLETAGVDANSLKNPSEDEIFKNKNFLYKGLLLYNYGK